jgi:hypothetical protein
VFCVWEGGGSWVAHGSNVRFLQEHSVHSLTQRFLLTLTVGCGGLQSSDCLVIKLPCNNSLKGVTATGPP